MLSPADECWCLVIQARASELLGRSVEATSYLQQAEQLAHALGRGPDHVQRLMNDTGPDVR
jgi:hypothetical protein